MPSVAGDIRVAPTYSTFRTIAVWNDGLGSMRMWLYFVCSQYLGDHEFLGFRFLGRIKSFPSPFNTPYGKG